MRPIFSACLLAAVAAGCSKSNGSLAGSVSYKGKPVTGGILLCVDSTGKSFPGSLNPDGSYLCPNLPPGDYVVTIKTLKANPLELDEASKEMMAKQGLDSSEVKMPDVKQMKETSKVQMKDVQVGQYVEIPKKYADSKTSGLAVKIGSGSQSQDLTLTD